MRRIQLRRTKGWRKPSSAIVVARPSRWGNPIPWQGDWITWVAIVLGHKADGPGRRAAAVDLYRAWMTDEVITVPSIDEGGWLEFSDGTSVSMGGHCRNLAAAVASMVAPPVMPERPALGPLVGHDLACWCPLDQPCHADVLLDMAAGAGVADLTRPISPTGRKILLDLYDAERHGTAMLIAARFHPSARDALTARGLIVRCGARSFVRLTTDGRGVAIRLQHRSDL